MKNGFKNFVVKFYIVLVVVAFLLSAISVALLNKQALTLVPLDSSTRDSIYEISTFDDASDNGASVVAVPVVTDNSIQYGFTIRDGYEYPYAGMSLYARPDLNSKIKHFMDFSGYTGVRLKAKVAGNSSLVISVKTFVKGLTVPDSPGTRKSNDYTLTPVNGVIDRIIPITALQTPEWWYSSNKTTSEKIGASDYSQVMEVVFQNGEDAVRNQNVTVTIEEITLVKDLSHEVAGAVSLFLLFVIVISVVRFRKTAVREEKSDKIIISYDRVEIENENDTDVHRIVEYIASNYPNPEFSVEQLAKGAGVSTSRIPTLLKKQYSMNFKQYLNTIRITEAKRLLLETEHQIVTIAHSVGYNNIPHFNRTFKQVTGLSPKQYRDNPELAIDNLPGSGEK